MLLIITKVTTEINRKGKKMEIKWYSTNFQLNVEKGNNGKTKQKIYTKSKQLNS